MDQPTATTGIRSRTQIAALIGAGTIMLGSMLPWATARSAFGQISMSGLEGDGIVTLVLGAALGLAAWLRHHQRGWQITAAVGSALVLFVGILDYVTIGSIVGDQYATASVGPGVYLVILGAALVGGASIAALSARSS